MIAGCSPAPGYALVTKAQLLSEGRFAIYEGHWFGIGLATQSDGAGEALFAILADDGGSRRADELSKGTQFQLYLALRIAGYHEYAGLRQPPSAVPFVADDIMETFDNERSEEAFSLLAKMAEVGQVIYLTHQEHLCAIAKKVCPDVQLHRLP